MREEILEPMPRPAASSANSRGVQVLTGRSAASGVSQGSRHELHELHEREGGVLPLTMVDNSA
jgi:hypothetical protein